MLAAGTSHTPHKAPRGANHYTRLHDTRHACGGLKPHTAQSTPRGTTLHKAASMTHRHACGAPAMHRTKHPKGHKTTQGCTSHRHACGGLQPHTAQSTPRGTTLHRATRPAQAQHHTNQPTPQHTQATKPPRSCARVHKGHVDTPPDVPDKPRRTTTSPHTAHPSRAKWARHTEMLRRN